MNLEIVDQTAEVVAVTRPVGAAGLPEFIESCGRVAWRSEAKGEPWEFIGMLMARGHESVLEHAGFSARIVTNRAIANELTRHRHASFTQESTRYVDGVKRGVVFIRPSCAPDGDIDVREWGLSLQRWVHPFGAWVEGAVQAVDAYRQMRASGAKPQDARGVLPLDLATNLVMTANLREWRHIMNLRSAPAAHPQMRALMRLILAACERHGLGEWFKGMAHE